MSAIIFANATRRSPATSAHRGKSFRRATKLPRRHCCPSAASIRLFNPDIAIIDPELELRAVVRADGRLQSAARVLPTFFAKGVCDVALDRRRIEVHRRRIW